MNLLEEFEELETRAGETVYFVKLYQPNKIQCWKQTREQNEILMSVLQVRDVSIEELKRMKLWDQLTAAIQKEVEQHEATYRNAVQERMDHARSKRQKKYPNIPRELECTQCHERQMVSPGVTSQRVEKSGKTLDDWLGEYKCQKCNPTRGKGKRGQRKKKQKRKGKKS